MWLTQVNTRLTQAVKPYIGSESRFLPTPPAFDAPVRGLSRKSPHNVSMWWSSTSVVFNLQGPSTHFKVRHSVNVRLQTGLYTSTILCPNCLHPLNNYYIIKYPFSHANCYLFSINVGSFNQIKILYCAVHEMWSGQWLPNLNRYHVSWQVTAFKYLALSYTVFAARCYA